jgi:hypothetical protein
VKVLRPAAILVHKKADSPSRDIDQITSLAPLKRHGDGMAWY